MRLPDLVAYQAALQHPATAFADPQLRSGTVACGRLGLPRGVAGNFAVTYQLRAGSQQWAVRCFHREAADRASRYAEISRSLAHQRGGPLVHIEYVEAGVRIASAWYPITKMPWVEGHPLNRVVEACSGSPGAVENLERRFVELVADLRRRGIAHGDLQHGNILVDRTGTLRLVDYDGMFVPALRGRPASECGDPNYQHPRRTTQFDAGLDRFAALVIVVALRALVAAPRLWEAYNTGDNLLFRRSDFVDPSRSALFRELSTLPAVRELTERLARVCQDEYSNVPLLEDFLQPGAGAAQRSPHPIKAGHVAVLNRLYGPRPAHKRVAKGGRSWKLHRTVVQQAIAFSADGELMATGDRDGKISVREAASGRTRRTLRLPPVAVPLQSLAFTPTGGLLVAVASGGSITVWLANGHRRLQEFTIAGRSLGHVVLSSRGEWVAAASDDGMVRCWSVTTGRLVAVCTHTGPVSGLAVSVDGRWIAVVGPRAQVHIWRSGRPVGRLGVKGARCVAFSDDGAQVAVGSASGRVTLWEVATCRLDDEVELTGPLQSVALSSGAAHLGATGLDGSIWMRRLPTRSPRNAAEEEPHLVRLFEWLRRVALL